MSASSSTMRIVFTCSSGLNRVWSCMVVALSFPQEHERLGHETQEVDGLWKSLAHSTKTATLIAQGDRGLTKQVTLRRTDQEWPKKGVQMDIFLSPSVIWWEAREDGDELVQESLRLLPRFSPEQSIPEEGGMCLVTATKQRNNDHNVQERFLFSCVVMKHAILFSLD